MAAALSTKLQKIVDRMQPLLKTAPWILRVTERKRFTGPVLEICERVPSQTCQAAEDGKQKPSGLSESGRMQLKDWGRLYTGNLRVCLPAVRSIMMNVTDMQGRPLDVHLLLDDKITFRGKIPLDETTGGKLSLLFRLHSRVRNQDRAELMAWRIARFTREETMYWLTKVSVSAYGERSVEWAKSGLRLMLAGQQKDTEEVRRLLDEVRK